MNEFNEQEEFWQGQFGDDYIERNKSSMLLASNLNFFSTALRRADSIDSVIELGANIGMNLKALSLLFPGQEQKAVEINKNAAAILASEIGEENVYSGSIFNYRVDSKYDLSFTKGVLIHVKPELLPLAYKVLYDSSSKYILIAEYYNPKPVMIDYRGHSNKLFKRDFCGDIMQVYPNLKLVDYGFIYKKDLNFPQDDITWFLMKKI